ncbi:GntR family transcriptional regulator [Streptomyces sp. NBC_00536]|uniref:GntR family transcriptional regulator n=1 Tax=Streptomyces sp. NBC_00536 TaxID=2975769 RepID=UPI002E8210C3|nr:GntR family transcriptional regulator [Streptomyces sp. NBC_00536]WUC79023.1 GntR family transcriptional regulator [Streptomyces sp. NBC_00536]
MTHPAPSRRHAIAEDLRNQISTGRLRVGERLPSEAQLAARYKVSTPTLRNALALLQGEGLIEKIHGSGNFIRHPLHKITYLGGGHTRAVQLAPDGVLSVSVSTTNLRAQGPLATLLKVAPRSPLTEFLHLCHDGTTPHSLTRVYVPRDLAPAVIPDPPSCSVVTATLASLRPPLAEVQERINARLPTPEEAAVLRISQSLAILVITRVATDVIGRVVEAAILVLPGDRSDALFATRHAPEEGNSNK